MLILKHIIENLYNDIPNIPIETGGIIGSSDNKTIDYYAFDLNSGTGHFCEYTPNTEYLNEIIESWQKRDINFKGIFHTHFGYAGKLSNEDINYIKTIMLSMPEEIDELFFPVITLPNKNMLVWIAERKKAKVSIHSEEITIV